MERWNSKDATAVGKKGRSIATVCTGIVLFGALRCGLSASGWIGCGGITCRVGKQLQFNDYLNDCGMTEAKSSFECVTRGEVAFGLQIEEMVW